MRLVILILILSGFLTGADRSVTIVVGKKASADGSVMVAHNESIAGANFINYHTSPAGKTKRKYQKILSGEVVRHPSKSNGFFWIQVPGRKHCDSYFSHKGITVTENFTPSRSSRNSSTGISFYLIRLAIQPAASASDAVNRIGRLVERYGYRESGTTICVADSNEAWIVHIMKGKFWVAKRVPDNEVAIVTSSFIIDKINLTDKANYRGSKDIIEYAVKRNWYDLEKEGFIGLLSLKDNINNKKQKKGSRTSKAVLKQWQLKIIEGSFNFADTFNSAKSKKVNPGSTMRWFLAQILQSRKLDPLAPLPFSFVPGSRIELTDLFTLLRNHYENSDLDLTDDYKKGSPNLINSDAVCNKDTIYSFVSWLRNDKQLPLQLRPVIWMAMGQPDSNAYTPWYSTLNSIPEGYNTVATKYAVKKHFSKSIIPSVSAAFDDFAALNDKVNSDYRNRIRVVKKEWRNFENYLFKALRKNEREYVYIFQKKPVLGMKLATCYIHNIALKKWFIATELLHKLSAL